MRGALIRKPIHVRCQLILRSVVLSLPLLALPLHAEESESAAGPAETIVSRVLSEPGLTFPLGDKGKVRFRVESKFHVRHSSSEEKQLDLPLPPDFFPADGIFALRTPDSGTSFEVSNVALGADVDFGPLIGARFNVHFIDLYNRNPTSTADEIRVREAWIRFGRELAPMEPIFGTGAYVEIGRAPRFTKQVIRRLESYGLWGTAVGRFEEDQIQIGGSIGNHFYVKGSVANPNPLFMRDPNALAGDNGTEDRARGNVDPDYQSGFPILYDAFPNDVNFGGDFQWGGGAGVRFLDGDGRDGLDVFGWYFSRELENSAPIDGSFYGGDLDLLSLTPEEVPELEGVPPELDRFDTSGNRKWETGVNVEGRLANFHLFAQYVFQSIANLERDGFEAEIAYRHSLGGLFDLGGIPVLNWVQPDFRFSVIDSRFKAPPISAAKSLGWDWYKYDIGVRVGIMRGVDLTLEYAINETVGLHPNEFLSTLRVAL